MATASVQVIGEFFEKYGLNMLTQPFYPGQDSPSAGRTVEEVVEEEEEEGEVVVGEVEEEKEEVEVRLGDIN